MLGFGPLGANPLGPAPTDPRTALLSPLAGRPTSYSLRSTANASASGEVILTFVTITHPNMHAAIRVVSEDDSGISYANGKIVNYRLDGLLYKGMPFRLSYLSDGENLAQANAAIPNIDQEIGEQVRALTTAPSIRFRCIKASDFDELYDEDNARNPIGIPTVEYDADYLYLRDVQGNDMVVMGSISTFDLGNEPYPPTRTIKEITPALYR